MKAMHWEANEDIITRIATNTHATNGVVANGNGSAPLGCTHVGQLIHRVSERGNN